MRLVYVSTIALVVLAIFIVIGGGLAEFRDQTHGAFKDTVQLLLTALLPLFGTWVGTVLAFYYSKENFEAASRGTLDVVRTISQRLASTKVVDAMMPVGRIIRLDLTKEQTPGKIVISDVSAKFDSVGANTLRISRLPIFDADGKCVAFLHRGVWMEMLATAPPAQLADKTKTELGSLWTAQYPLGKGQSYKDVITSAFAFVAEDRTLADAKAKMESQTGCQDVIVTHQGNADEPVLGWVSNVDISRLSQA